VKVAEILPKLSFRGLLHEPAGIPMRQTGDAVKPGLKASPPRPVPELAGDKPE
jgi:hypothetical protein